MSSCDHPNNFLELNNSHAAPTTPSRLQRIKSPITHFFSDNCDLILVVASQAYLASANFLVKGLNSMDPPIPILEVILIRMVSTPVFSSSKHDPIQRLYHSAESPFLGPKGVRLLLILKGLGSFLGIFGFYSSLQWISLSDATGLAFLAPLTATFARSVILKEKFVKNQAIGVVLSLFGVILIARPIALFGYIPEVVDEALRTELDEPASPIKETTPDQRLLAVGRVNVPSRCIRLDYICLNRSLRNSLVVCLRVIDKRASALHSILASFSQSIIAATIGMIVTQTPFVIPSSFRLALTLLEIGVAGLTAQLLLNMGILKGKERAKMAIYTQIVWASVAEKIELHTSPPLLSIVGIAIITGCAVFVTRTKEQTSPEEKGRKEPMGMVERPDDVVMEEGLLGKETQKDVDEHESK
ncbi:hypothetical protein V5O48_013268 [Marasmius crinis-equi]|uniref:EamA domain-containing protein n=1 Tax=Marasmius crinis-equi TaxID=585013 RepID=A0ABR3F0J8_9AGAR